ncbi:MAG: hypothetical protein P4M15_12140 [Alphaproteobacteria bacterium]|nr:hypothetical protein [Alphaproteobacteria bacterium]
MGRQIETVIPEKSLFQKTPQAFFENAVLSGIQLPYPAKMPYADSNGEANWIPHKFSLVAQARRKENFAE